MRVIAPDMREGARGPGVWLLQSALSALHYAVPLNGVFDEATGQAVTAYRKLTGLVRVPDTDAQVFHLLQRRAAPSMCATRGKAGTWRPISPHRCSPRSNRAGTCGASTR